MAEETKETASSKDSPKKGAKKKSAKKKATGKKMASVKRAAAKKTTEKKPVSRGAGKWASKKEFVLSFPEEVMPAEIVKRSETEGFVGDKKITAEYASTERSKARKAGIWPTKGKGANGVRGRSAPAVRGDEEAEFRRAARGITLDRAQAILDEIRAAYDGE